MMFRENATDWATCGQECNTCTMCASDVFESFTPATERAERGTTAEHVGHFKGQASMPHPCFCLGWAEPTPPLPLPLQLQRKLVKREATGLVENPVTAAHIRGAILTRDTF